MTGLRVLLYANVDRAEAGGVQAVVRGLRGYLVAQGHTVATGWAEDSGHAPPPDDGWVQQFPVRSSHARWLHLPTLARLLLRLRRARPQVVNIHYASPSSLYFIALAPWLGFRVVVTCHGSDLRRPLEGDAPYLKAVLGGADAVTAVSAELAARIEELGAAPRRRPAVIANGIDTTFWQPPPGGRTGDGTLVIAAVGRLEPVKGFDLLIEACAALSARDFPLRLVLVGEGSQKAALAAQAARLGIAERVTFAGRLAPEDIRARLYAADLFALPSRSEGMPLALMEAMACAMPCVAADVGGVARTAEGTARLVPPEDPAALAEAIAALAGDPQARAAMGEKARERARAFSVAGAHAAYEALMRDLVRRPRA
jgi:glycosyltransferase involved in cell wall biosynthesis